MRIMPEMPGFQWEEGCIYYILSGETGRIKIGFTNSDPSKRLRSLRTGSPTKIAIIAIHPGTLAMERDLHEKFAVDRLHGEWFDFSDDLLVHVFEICTLTIAAHLAAGEDPPAWATIGRERIIALIEDDQPESVH
jgi:hypothetical protein